jgi:hypothetical protein
MVMKLIFAALMTAAMLAATGIGQASAQNAPPPPAAAAPQDVPGLGEIMTLQQLRHIKLWFAGQAGNWPLADYEVGELGEGFEDVSKLIGGETVDKVVGAQMKAVDKAVAAKDRAGFTAAFDNLTAGCNNCHHMLDHGFIAIRRPTSLPYSDQSFAPQK